MLGAWLVLVLAKIAVVPPDVRYVDALFVSRGWEVGVDFSRASEIVVVVTVVDS